MDILFTPKTNYSEVYKRVKVFATATTNPFSLFIVNC